MPYHLAGKGSKMTLEKILNIYAIFRLFLAICHPLHWSSAGLIDFFEPTYIEDALTKKPINLGSLIFGKREWQRLRAGAVGPISTSDSDDPLTLMFRGRGKVEIFVLSTQCLILSRSLVI